MFRKLFKNSVKCRYYYTVGSNSLNKKNVEAHNKLSKQLQAKIKMKGPISVADYMKEVLTNPISGYYMHSDVFGQTGDFITSPELGQLFGEMVAVWFINEWKKIGSPKPLQIVELGPGRGSLCQDMLKVFKHFNELTDVSVHLVEVSPFLSDLQARNLCLTTRNTKDDTCKSYRKGENASGVSFSWYTRLDDVPREFSLVLAHEFFDALPIQKFQKTEKGWREILVDIDDNNENKFKFVLSNVQTPGSKLLIPSNETRSHVEISKDSIVLIKQLAERLEEDGGIALIADYGHTGEGTDTFRAFKKHKLHDPLLEPGSADLTADVDFNLLKSVATMDNKTIAFGPVLQSEFLNRMGIAVRLEQLLQHASAEQEKALKFAVEMMTDHDKMGKKFKLLSLFPDVLTNHLKKFPVAGFS